MQFELSEEQEAIFDVAYSFGQENIKRDRYKQAYYIMVLPRIKRKIK